MNHKKHIWNRGKALFWYMHPFKDEPHLRKKFIRWPRWEPEREPESALVEVYNEELGCWLDIEPKRVYRIYRIEDDKC